MLISLAFSIDFILIKIPKMALKTQINHITITIVSLLSSCLIFCLYARKPCIEREVEL